MAESGVSLRKGGEPCKTLTIQFVKSSEIFHTGPVAEGTHTLVAPPSYTTDSFCTAATNNEMRCLSPGMSDNANCVQTLCVKDSSFRNEESIKKSKEASSGKHMTQADRQSVSLTMVSEGSVHPGDMVQGSVHAGDMVQDDMVQGSVHAGDMVQGSVHAVNMVEGSVHAGDMVQGDMVHGSVQAGDMVQGPVHADDMVQCDMVLSSVLTNSLGDLGSISACIHRVSDSVVVKKGSSRLQPVAVTFPRTPEAKPVLTKEEYLTLCTNEKDAKLEKFRRLAYEVVALKTQRPNAKDKMHSAANRVPIHVDFHMETVLGIKNNNSFICSVFVDGVSIASGQGARIKDSKTNAYEATLQKIFMPHIRIVRLDPESYGLEASKEPFTSPPCEPSPVPLSKMTSQHLLHIVCPSEKVVPAAHSLEQFKPAGITGKLNSATHSAVGASEKVKPLREVSSKLTESNLVAACLKRRFDEQKSLEDFVIVEPLVPTPDCTPAHTLRRSADFNHMLLEYEFIFKGEAARCILRVEGQVLADINGASKLAAKNQASVQALDKLKNRCWVIKTKKAVDSDTKISKDEMLNELIGVNEQSSAIGCDNVGNRLLRKMGWAGGGVGKNSSGIVEPVTLKSVLNREGLGLGATKGITEDFKKRVKEIIENYAASGNQDDLVFDFDFRLDERQIIHNESRRLNLRSKCRGRGRKRYLCVRRKLSANELFDHIMSRGGETARYVLVPPDCHGGSEPQPGSDNTRWSSMVGVASKGKQLETYTDKFLTRADRKDSLSRTNFGAPCSGRGLLSTPINCGPLSRATWSTRVTTRGKQVRQAGTERNTLFHQAGPVMAGCNCGSNWVDKFSLDTDEKCVGNSFWGSSHLANVPGERRMSSIGNDCQCMGNGDQNMGRGRYGNEGIGSGSYFGQITGHDSYGNQSMGCGSYGNQNMGRGRYGNEGIGSGSYFDQSMGHGSYGNQNMGSGYYAMGDSSHIFENFNLEVDKGKRWRV